jgi:capsular polysaccharide biosynthesis protein
MKRKLKIFYKQLIILIFKLFYKKIKLGNENNSNKNILINRKNINYLTKIYKFAKTSVYTDNLYNVSYIKNNSIIQSVSFEFNVNGYYKKKNKNSILSNGTPAIKKKLHGRTLSLIQGASGKNYFHFLYDVVPKIYLINNIMSLNKFDYIYISKVSNNILNPILKHFKINKKKIIFSDNYKYINCDYIYVVEHPYYKNLHWWKNFAVLPKWIVGYLRNKLASNIKYEVKNKNKIFIDRSDTSNTHNQIINNKSLINFLKKKNFLIYKLSNFNLYQQIKIFKEAKYIISPHGASLANLCFCSKGTKVIEIKSKKFENNNLYKRISKITGLEYSSITYNGKNNKYINLNLHEFKNFLIKKKFII